MIPEYVARSWWERILYNQSANRLRRALIGRPHTVVVGVPYRRDEEPTIPRMSAKRKATRRPRHSRCTLRRHA